MANARAKRVTIFGGSGFVGRYCVKALAEKGYFIRVAVRQPSQARHLFNALPADQIEFFKADVTQEASVEDAVKDADDIINCVGILFETGNQTFEKVQSDAPRMIAQAAQNNGKNRIIHLSAIGADSNSPAQYAITKARAEQAIMELAPQSVILRPSIIFGPEDNFFNQFADMARFAPALPLIGGGKTKFQPVYVGDVAKAVVSALEGNLTPGIYELGGPDIASFKELMKILLDHIEKKRVLAPIPFPVAHIQAAFLQLMPKPLLTRDQVRLLKTDNIVSPKAITDKMTFEGMGITPVSMAQILPTYLDKKAQPSTSHQGDV